MDEERAAEDALDFLRGHTTGDLRFNEHQRQLRYVIAPGGRLVAPVMYAMLDAVDTVLFVPECTGGAMEVHVTLAGLDPDGPDGGLTDRWRIYHGEPHDAHWAVMDIDAARYHDFVIDGPALVRPNPLAEDEARLCRHVNQNHRAELGRVCRHFARARAEDPLLVGVDPMGFDVRRRFDVIRLRPPQPMSSPAEAERLFQQMLRESTSTTTD